MNLEVHFLLLIFLASESYGVIYYLNESEYDRMPPIYKLDSYNSCLQSPSDAYCSVSFHLVSDEPNELLHMIEEYSNHTATHLNHTDLRYGVCVQESCQPYVQDKTAVSESTLEGCLNQSLWEGYKLKTKIDQFKCYTLSDYNFNLHASDVVMGLIVFAIIVLNIVGSLFDVYCSSRKSGDRNILLNFSIKRNWERLISTTRHLDLRLKRLKSINGFRSTLMFGVIALHSVWPYIIAAKNSHHFEMIYYSFLPKLILAGPIMMQGFFLMSGFLLAYNIEIISESQQINWRLVPRAMLLRYLRLTPAYAIMIALTATWLKFLGPGPLWDTAAEISFNDCRRRWWLNLLYMNNLVYNSQCLLHSWSLAAEMQLCCAGLILCVILKRTRCKKPVFIIAVVAGIVISAVQTYLQDLDSILILSPSTSRSILKADRTFNEIYKSAHGNFASFVIGLALAHIVHNYQKKEIDGRKLQKLKYIYWSVLPLIITVLMSGAVFYRDAPRDPLYIRVLYAAFAKPVIGALIAIFIAGMIFKLENIYRKFFESRLWTIPSKLSYCVYIVHFPFIQYYVSMQTSLFHSSYLNMVIFYVFVTVVSFVIAVLLHLLVEAPFIGLTKHIIPGHGKSQTDVKIKANQIKQD